MDRKLDPATLLSIAQDMDGSHRVGGFHNLSIQSRPVPLNSRNTTVHGDDRTLCHSRASEISNYTSIAFELALKEALGTPVSACIGDAELERRERGVQGLGILAGLQLDGSSNQGCLATVRPVRENESGLELIHLMLLFCGMLIASGMAGNFLVLFGEVVSQLGAHWQATDVLLSRSFNLALKMKIL
ncbi:hypothetical protein BJ508DRAFT_314103 [Ascobolus immersus RN42]|uniref:Uncharacterized protein n=1 Tax=Ascobolus immersus RN42 TaxID=1160509 RepID=A0A3N4HM00_ASCIM|nr:hypothetical protein BJ508DRAFT_314103 [Ascobolus immersus RN42]